MSQTVVGFHTLHDARPLLRQTPLGAGVWEQTRFVIKPAPETALDWLVVYDDLGGPLATAVPPARRICVISEPPSVKTYPRRFLNQFGHVVSPYPVPGYRGNLILSHSALPWHFGLGRYDETPPFATLEAFAALACPDKLPKLSVVCSDKVITAEHRRRLVFLDRLKQALGDRVVHFGRGFREILDKADAILPCQFHLVLENNRLERGWTEKLADAYLGWAFPVFSGGPGLAADFPEEAFRAVDLDDHDGAIALIVQLLETPDFFMNHRQHLAEARRRILEEHNVFALLSRIAAQAEAAGVPSVGTEVLFPTSSWRMRRRLKAAARRVLGLRASQKGNA